MMVPLWRTFDRSTGPSPIVAITSTGGIRTLLPITKEARFRPLPRTRFSVLGRILAFTALLHANTTTRKGFVNYIPPLWFRVDPWFVVILANGTLRFQRQGAWVLIGIAIGTGPFTFWATLGGSNQTERKRVIVAALFAVVADLAIWILNIHTPTRKRDAVTNTARPCSIRTTGMSFETERVSIRAWFKVWVTAWLNGRNWNWLRCGSLDGYA